MSRTSSKTQNWHVDGNGSFGIGSLSVGASGGTSSTISATAQSSLEHITEATRKSANTVKSLHKVEVRGVSEAFVQNRSTRRLRNPYWDRTLTINVFELIKHFSVGAYLFEVLPALFIDVGGLTFDADFVVSNSDFLRERLLDPTLAEDLPQALQGAKPLPPNRSDEAATDIAKNALFYLYSVSNVFHLPEELAGSGNPNVPVNSFDARKPRSGLNDAVGNKLGSVFATLNVYWAIYEDARSDGRLDAEAVSLALSIAQDMGPKWTALETTDPNSVANVLDRFDFTEIFRRLPGFLATVGGQLKSAMGPAEAEDEAERARDQAVFVLSRLLEHLRCNENYYVQQFLIYLGERTLNQAIVDFVDRVMDKIGMGQDLRRKFDVNRSFVSKQQIVVPGTRPLTDEEIGALGDGGKFSFNEQVRANQVDVPCDGVHLEAVAGHCILEDAPPPPELSADVNVKDAHVVLTGTRSGAPSPGEPITG